MARGFESKDVEFQQAEAERVRSQPSRATTTEQRDIESKRRTLQLALTRARGDLSAARTDAHRHMLTEAIRALEARLGQTDSR